MRTRAKLPSAVYSLETLKKERRFELAFEGRRWADIRRWGDAPALLGKQIGVDIYNRGVREKMKNFGTGYTVRYNETQGFFPIPQSEIDLSDGVLQQSPGWGAEAQFQGW
ncbi:SusD family protein [Bacteroidales bacterium Barb6]|nr:SusD family protein [Bacteroidales bacterium Barb6]